MPKLIFLTDQKFPFSVVGDVEIPSFRDKVINMMMCQT